MSNAILAYGNLIDAAAIYGGSWLPALPLANLQDRRLGKLARSTNATTGSTQFDLNLGATKLVRVVALVNHNLSVVAQYRVLCATDAAFVSVVADSGWLDVWPVVYPFGSLPWGSSSWWGGRTSDDIIAELRAPAAYTLAAATNAQYVRIEIADATNAAGYVQLGRVFVGDGWQPVRNMVYGASLAWENRSEVQEALSGAEYFNRRSTPRVARISFEGMSEDEAMAAALEMQRIAGVTQEVFFLWDPADTTHSLRRQFLGRLRTLSPIENPGPDRWRAPFEVKELL
jgi:hypothetical protein